MSSGSCEHLLFLADECQSEPSSSALSPQILGKSTALCAKGCLSTVPEKEAASVATLRCSGRLIDTDQIGGPIVLPSIADHDDVSAAQPGASLVVRPSRRLLAVTESAGSEIAQPRFSPPQSPAINEPLRSLNRHNDPQGTRSDSFVQETSAYFHSLSRRKKQSSPNDNGPSPALSSALTQPERLCVPDHPDGYVKRRPNINHLSTFLASEVSSTVQPKLSKGQSGSYCAVNEPSAQPDRKGSASRSQRRFGSTHCLSSRKTISAEIAAPYAACVEPRVKLQVCIWFMLP